MGQSTYQPAIYLFKSARRPLYRQQNLHLLAAERGTVVEVAWNRSWVAAEYFDEGTIARGDRAAFVLTERPYTTFAPVRAGEVVEARWEPLSLRLWVQLGTWIGASDRSGFARALRDAQNGDLPGEKFVAPRRDDTRLVAWFDEDEDAGWKSAIDAALGIEGGEGERPYADSAFFRSAGLRVNGQLHAARREPLPRGVEAELLLRFHNPHMTDEALAALQLEAITSKDSLKAAAPADVPRDGESVVKLRATGPAPELTVQLSPNPAQHTALVLRFPAPRTEAAATRTSEAVSIERTALLDAWQATRGLVDPVRELRVAESFLRLLPDEHRIAERRAILLHDTGDATAAYDALRALDTERLDDAARFLLIAEHVRRGNVRAAAALLANVDLEEENRLDQLLKLLDEIQPPELDRFVRELMSRIPDGDDLHAILERVGRRLTSPELIADTAEHFFLHTGDQQEAWSFLQERRRTLRLSQPVIADAAIELAPDDDSGDLFDLLEHRINNLAGTGRLDEAIARLKMAANRLSRAHRDRLHHRLADRLDEAGRTEEAAHLLVELAYDASRTGDLGDATDAIERARGLMAAAGGTAPEWLKEATARVEAAWRDVQALDEWRTSDRERRAEHVRARLKNSSILIVGGFEKPHYTEALVELTGAKVDVAESFRTESDDIAAYAGRIRSGRYGLVLLRIRFMGHSVSEAIRDACNSAGIRCEFVNTGGLRGLEDALWRATQ